MWKCLQIFMTRINMNHSDIMDFPTVHYILWLRMHYFRWKFYGKVQCFHLKGWIVSMGSVRNITPILELIYKCWWLSNAKLWVKVWVKLDQPVYRKWINLINVQSSHLALHPLIITSYLDKEDYDSGWNSRMIMDEPSHSFLGTW